MSTGLLFGGAIRCKGGPKSAIIVDNNNTNASSLLEKCEKAGDFFLQKFLHAGGLAVTKKQGPRMVRAIYLFHVEIREIARQCAG